MVSGVIRPSSIITEGASDDAPKPKIETVSSGISGTTRRAITLSGPSGSRGMRSVGAHRPPRNASSNEITGDHHLRRIDDNMIDQRARNAHGMRGPRKSVDLAAHLRDDFAAA